MYTNKSTRTSSTEWLSIWKSKAKELGIGISSCKCRKCRSRLVRNVVGAITADLRSVNASLEDYTKALSGLIQS